jgi:thioredoxin-related protein
MNVIDRLRRYTLRDDSIVGILFSASYCKWCTTFTSHLLSVSPGLSQYNIDIVLAGSDKTKSDYEEYASRLGWPAIDFDDPLRSDLRELYSIKTIPALVFIDSNGNIIDATGRFLVVDVLDTAYDLSRATKAIATRLGVEVDYDSDDLEF